MISTPARRRGRVILWGLAAAACYLAAVWIVARPFPVRLLYEGMAPMPPYRWVRPPAALAGSNEPPRPWSGSLPFLTSGSQSGSFATGDLQVIAAFRQNAIAPRAGESSVHVTLSPLDPDTVGPPPAGVRFDGNAYRVEAVYATGNQAAALQEPVTVVLRYPLHADRILRFDPPEWTTLQATVVQESMQIFASTDRLGIFVAATSLQPPDRVWLPYVIAAGVLVGAIAAFWYGMKQARTGQIR